MSKDKLRRALGIIQYFEDAFGDLSNKIHEGDFYCSHNNLSSLEGAPQEVKGSFYCYDNSKKFTEEDVRKVCKVGGKIYV